MDCAGARWRVLRVVSAEAVLLGSETAQEVPADPSKIRLPNSRTPTGPVLRPFDELRHSDVDWTEAQTAHCRHTGGGAASPSRGAGQNGSRGRTEGPHRATQERSNLRRCCQSGQRFVELMARDLGAGRECDRRERRLLMQGERALARKFQAGEQSAGHTGSPLQRDTR